MIEKYSDKHPLPNGRPKKDINKAKNRSGCLILMFIGLFLGYIAFIFTAYLPGFIAYRQEWIRKFTFSIIETIHHSLTMYSNKHPKNLFPAEINNYEVLSQIVNDAGKSIPNNQADAKISYFKYETTDINHYILQINIEKNTSHFFILYPDGIVEVQAPTDDKSVIELVKILLFMDRALKENKIAEYLKYYQPDTIFHIEDNTYKGRPTDKNYKNFKSIVYEDMDLYSNSLLNFYSNTVPEYRKRSEISVRKNKQNWEVHSSYIEEGTIKGQKYLKDGRNIYEIALYKSQKYIVNDKSFTFIYLLENQN
jgi:hypothetical protein